MQVIETNNVPVKAWVDGVEFEEEAKKQVLNLASMPFVYKHVAVMPDVHAGIGATVGSVVATRSAVIPAACGVDIGCGMLAVKLNLTASELPDNLAAVRAEIESMVPHGRSHDGGPNDIGAWNDIPGFIMDCWVSDFSERFEKICLKHPKIARANHVKHLGTLGTGNHFIEMCLDQNQDVWVMLHSGSRGVGGRIGSYFIELAKEDMRKWFINLPDANLSYLVEGTKNFDDYIEAIGWAQDFARANRDAMLLMALASISKGLGRRVNYTEAAINCHHNYVERENHFGSNVLVTRKGAVRAREGEMGIIPGSMGTRSYIVRGKGNRDSFCSCSHGAGRRMSRTQAKKTFTLEDHAVATAGVECRKDESVLDETPGAYKSIDSVMEAQSDLVDVVYTLKQVLCIKG